MQSYITHSMESGVLCLNWPVARNLAFVHHLITYWGGLPSKSPDKKTLPTYALSTNTLEICYVGLQILIEFDKCQYIIHHQRLIDMLFILEK